MVKGIGTVIYHVADLDRAKAWYAAAFGQTPYFDQPFYVGFNIGGYELGLDPDPGSGKSGAGGSVAYWRVDAIDEAVRHFVRAGGTVASAVQDVGEGHQGREDRRSLRQHHRTPGESEFSVAGGLRVSAPVCVRSNSP